MFYGKDQGIETIYIRTQGWQPYSKGFQVYAKVQKPLEESPIDTLTDK